MTSGVNTVNIQAVGRFEVLSPLPNSNEHAQNGYCTGLSHFSRTWFTDPTPFDVRNRMPMNANFYANPGGYGDVSSDTVLTIYPTKFLDISTRLHLQGLDPTATQFENFLVGSRFPFGAINRNNYLLCGYRTNDTQERAFHLVLTKLVNTATVGITAYGPSSAGTGSTGTTQISSQLIRIPTPNRSQFSFKTFWAVDDYFLVWCNGYDLFKINQDGSFQQVNGTFMQATGPVAPTATSGKASSTSCRTTAPFGLQPTTEPVGSASTALIQRLIYRPFTRWATAYWASHTASSPTASTLCGG